jgi:hypothetical protein
VVLCLQVRSHMHRRWSHRHIVLVLLARQRSCGLRMLHGGSCRTRARHRRSVGAPVGETAGGIRSGLRRGGGGARERRLDRRGFLVRLCPRQALEPRFDRAPIGSFRILHVHQELRLDQRGLEKALSAAARGLRSTMARSLVQSSRMRRRQRRSHSHIDRRRPAGGWQARLEEWLRRWRQLGQVVAREDRRHRARAEREGWRQLSRRQCWVSR